jgi:hypothetical protein
LRLVNLILDQRFQVGVGDGLFLVGQFLEALENRRPGLRG